MDTTVVRRDDHEGRLRVVRRAPAPPAGSTVHPWGREALALALVAALPALIAGAVMVRQGWTPVADTATIVLRSEQVFTVHTPRVGQPSTLASGGRTFSFGPMAYWVLSVPLLTGRNAAVPVALALLNGTMLAGAVALLWRHGGRALAVAGTVAALVFSRAVDPFVLADPWNPWVGIAPLVLLAAVAWAIASGGRERWLLPLAVGLGSFAVQAHHSSVVPAVLLSALVGLAAWGPWLVRRWLARPPAVPSRGVVLACVAVAAVCWALPAHQQATGSPGNLTAQVEADAGASRGVGGAVATLSRTLGVTPGWTARPQGFFADIRTARADARPVDVVVTVVWLVAIAAVGAAAVRRRDRRMVAATAVVVALLAAVALEAWLLPAARPDTWGYTTRWTPLAGVAATLLLAVAAVRAVRGTTAAGQVSALAARVPVPAAAWGTVAVLAATATLIRPHNPERGLYDGASELATAIERHVEPGEPYRVGWVDDAGASLVSLSVRAVKHGGGVPRLADPYADVLGDGYDRRGVRCAGIVLLGVEDDLDHPHPDAVATAPFTGTDGRTHHISAAIVPDVTPLGGC